MQVARRFSRGRTLASRLESGGRRQIKRNIMTKRQAKIKALKIVSGYCFFADHMIFSFENYTEKEEEKILEEIYEIGRRLDNRVQKLLSKQNVKQSEK